MTCFRITPNELTIIIHHLRSAETCDDDREKYLQLFKRSVPGTASLELLQQAINNSDPRSDKELALKAFELRSLH